MSKYPKSGSDYIEDILDQSEREVLVENLAKFIRAHIWRNHQETRREQFVTDESVKKSRRKAREILTGNKTDLPPEINFADGENFRILEKAAEKGYIQNSNFRRPWHIRPFLQKHPVSFPYQHDEVVLYWGTSNAIFFKEEFTPDELDNQKSVLTTGHMSSGENEIGGSIDMENFEDQWGAESAIWLGFPNVAYHFAEKKNRYEGMGGVVLEIKISTDTLETMVAPLKKRSKDTGSSTNKALSGLDEIIEEFDEERFDTPLQAFYHYCNLARRTDPHQDLETAEIVHFAIQHGIELSEVVRVWDVENMESYQGTEWFYEEPVWETLDEYIKHLKNRYGEKLPGKENDESKEKFRDYIRKELRFLEEAETDIEKIGKLVSEIESSGADSEKLDEYSFLVSQLRDSFHYSDHFGQMELNDVVKLNSKNIKKTEKLCKEIQKLSLDLIKYEKRKAHKGDWTRDKRSEEELEKIEEKISKLPEGFKS
jgi:hypothetical protein